jgi:large subunit ribosomal protein L21
MYAVIESGGKQYRVELGSEIQVDRLDVKAGDSIQLERVLLVADGETTAVGRPVVDGAIVSAEVLRQERGDKVVVFKYKPKARTRVKKGARAELTRLRIADIAFGGRSAADDAQASESRKAKAAREAEKAATEKAATDQALAARLAAGEGTAPAAPSEPDAATRSPARRSGKARTGAAAEPVVESVAEPPPAEAAETEAETTAVAPEAAPVANDAEPESSAAAEPGPEDGVVGDDGETRKDD